MIVFPVIQCILWIIVDPTSGFNEDNGNSNANKGGLFPQTPASPSGSMRDETVQPRPLEGQSSAVPDVAIHSGSQDQAISPSSSFTKQTVPPASGNHKDPFPYLMNVPVFTETFKSTTRQSTGAYKRSKETDSGWKQDDQGDWNKHGNERGSEKQKEAKHEGSHVEGAHKKSLGHDHRDAAAKWKQGSESGDYEDGKVVEEYNKNKGRVYEKKWSWEKERGSGHGWHDSGKQGNDHWKGANLNEHDTRSHLDRGKSNWLHEGKRGNQGNDNWAKKMISQGVKEDAHRNHQKESGSSGHHENRYLKSHGNGYHGHGN